MWLAGLVPELRRCVRLFCSKVLPQIAELGVELPAAFGAAGLNLPADVIAAVQTDRDAGGNQRQA